MVMQAKNTQHTAGLEGEAQDAPLAAIAHVDELLDEGLEETFPASDPVAINIERPSDRRRAP